MPYRYNPNYVIAEDPTSYAIPDIEPAHFFTSKREDIKTIRKTFFRQWVLASIELWILIFLISTLYLGSGVNPNRYANNLEVVVADFDGDVAGSYFFNAFRQTPSGNFTLGWRYKYPNDYGYNIDNTIHDVTDGKVWATVVLRPNTTRLINESLSLFVNTSMLLTSPFLQTLPILVTYEEGRNAFTINNYVLPSIRSAIAVATASYSQTLRSQLTKNLRSSDNTSNNFNLQLTNTFRLQSLLVNPLSAQYHNLHPGYPYVGQLATTLGYVYIYLISGMVTGGAIKFLTPYVGKIHYLDLIVYRIFNGFFQGFIVSLIYSLIVLWFFGIHSGSLFMRYWMFNWLSALVFGLIFVLFTINLGFLANSLLTAFAILMLAGATLQISLELAPRFYRYGYGLPLYNIVNGGRHLIFGSHSKFGLNVGVLLIYFGVFWTLAVITSIFWMKKHEKKLRREKQTINKTSSS